MSAPAAANNPNVPPNTSDAKNFEGIWWPRAAGSSGFSSGANGPGLGGPPPTGGPAGPGAGPTESAPGSNDDAARLRCSPMFKLAGGGGGSTVLIAQSDRELVMAGEELTGTFQRIYIGASHPSASELVPQPNGNVVAHWEGNTLVADGIGYADINGKDIGRHVVERLHKEGNKLVVEATITDRNGTTRKLSGGWAWRPDLQYNESICEEDFDRYRVINGTVESENTRAKQ